MERAEAIITPPGRLVEFPRPFQRRWARAMRWLRHGAEPAAAEPVSDRRVVALRRR